MNRNEYVEGLHALDANSKKNAYWAVQVTGAVLELVSRYSPAGVSVNECRILNSIIRSELDGVPLGISEISNSLNIPRPTVSRIVADFYANGDLREEQHPEDGRRRKIRYTDSSIDRMIQWSRELQDLLKDLSPKEGVDLRD